MIGTVGVLLSGAVLSFETRTFDPSLYSQAVTECDQLAAHSADPFKVVPGLSSSEVNLPKAIKACKADLAKDPGNPRLQYLLARALTFSSLWEEGLPLIERAAALHYPQALFVTGYLYLTGEYDAPTNACRAGELIRESALYGRRAGQVGFVAWHLAGRFDTCEVRQDRDEMLAFLGAARGDKPDFYTSLLIDDLERQLRGIPTPVRGER